MALSATPTIALSAGLAALVMWRIYKRVRRLVGRQSFSPVRAWFATTLLPLLLLVLMAGALGQPLSLMSLLAGAAAGTGLGLYGLRLTRFEITPLGRFYTPNAHLGIALSLLLVGRLVYRLAQMYLLGTSLRPGADFSAGADFVRNPWTLLIVGTLLAYYACYALGLLRWQHRTRHEQS